jgi:tRNA uridine 5-carbamoylmethylation protein Kti12
MWKMFYDLARVYSKDPNGIVVLDSTNAARKYRLEAGKALRDLFETIDLISFHMKPETIYRQNLDREWPIPTEVLTQYIENFE